MADDDETIEVRLDDDDDAIAAAERTAAEYNKIAEQKNREAEGYKRQIAQSNLIRAQMEIQNNRRIVDGASETAAEQMRTGLANGDTEAVIEAQRRTAQAEALRIRLDDAE
jgi:hypothetical protein